MRVPHAIDHPAIGEAAEHHDDMTRQLTEAQRALADAKGALPVAREKDENAYAAAISQGKADPGTKTTTTAAAAIRDAERRVAALKKAVIAAEGAVEKEVGAHRGDLTAGLSDRLVGVDRAYAEAVDAYATAAQARGAILSALTWLSRGDTGRNAPTVGGWLPGLTTRRAGADVQPATFDEVTRAMREVLDPQQIESNQPGVGGSMATFLGVEPSG